MTRRRDDLVVGLVTLAGVATLVGAVLWVQQADLGERRAGVVARFRDVGAVQVGKAVLIRGVRAGRVEALELDDAGWVRVRLQLAPEVRLPPDPVVVVGASSLFGEWQATVMSRSAAPDNPDVRRQLAEASGQRGTLPGATLPDIAQLTAVAGRIAGDVASVAERFQAAFSDTAARELRATIGNVAALSQQLQATSRRQSRHLDSLSARVLASAAALQSTAAALDRTVGRVDSATSAGEIRRIVGDAAAGAEDLRAAATTLRLVAGTLAGTQGALVRTVARTDSVVAKVNAGAGTAGLLVNDPALYRNADSLMIEVRALVADLRANPKKYLSVRVF